jgi:NAD(P)-dependent dehydrogenase (short-subunit alcohol dehydrogenase family)
VSRPVIVTGSDSGIGRATAVALARAGHDVGVTWRSDEPGAQETAGLVEREGRHAAVVPLDLTDAPERPIEQLIQQLGGLWGLVNCAGANHRAALVDDTSDGWRNAIELNLTGPVLCARTAARAMIRARSGGRIVHVTSVHEHEPLRFAGAYSAAKAGLGMASRVMALELAGQGITVNAVAPGHIATPMTGKAGLNPATIDLPQIPVGRPGGPDEVAAVIAFLVSDAARYVTGVSVPVDGGLLLTAAVPLQDAVEGVPR